MNNINHNLNNPVNPYTQQNKIPTTAPQTIQTINEQQTQNVERLKEIVKTTLKIAGYTAAAFAGIVSILTVIAAYQVTKDVIINRENDLFYKNFNCTELREKINIYAKKEIDCFEMNPIKINVEERTHSSQRLPQITQLFDENINLVKKITENHKFYCKTSNPNIFEPRAKLNGDLTVLKNSGTIEFGNYTNNQPQGMQFKLKWDSDLYTFGLINTTSGEEVDCGFGTKNECRSSHEAKKFRKELHSLPYLDYAKKIIWG